MGILIGKFLILFGVGMMAGAIVNLIKYLISSGKNSDNSDKNE